MKNFFFIVLIFIFSCGSYQPSSHNNYDKFNSFENNDLSLNYPLNWLHLKKSIEMNNHDDVILHIAPKESIEYLNYITTDPDVAINSSSYPSTKNYFIIFKQSLSDITFEKEIESEIVKIERFKNHKMVKINDSYYESIMEVKQIDFKSKVREQFFKIVYIKEGNYYYRMAFVFNLIDKNKYIPDMQFILNSIQFKNPDTQLKFRPKS